MSVFKKTAYFLGLGPDEDYDDYEYPPQGEPMRGVSQERPMHSAAPAPYEQPAAVRAVPEARPAATVRSLPSTEASGSVRVVPSTVSATASSPRPASMQAEDIQPAVRIVESRPATPHALSPTSFNEAQAIGDRFKSGQPVIVNLEGADRDLRRRLVDFASGLCYGLGGKMDRVADNVFLLTPDDVEVSEAETQRALR